MKTSQSFTFYPTDFLLGTMLLSDAEAGALIRLLCYQWQEGQLPDEVPSLMRLAQTTEQSIRAILPKFQKGADGKLRHPKLEEVRKSLNAYKKSRSNIGKKGGRPAKKPQNHMVSACFPDEKHSERLPSPSPSPSPIIPLTPKGASADRKVSKMTPATHQASRIAAIFHRKQDAAWSDRELRAYRRLGAIHEEDLASVEAYYSAHWPPVLERNLLRHDLKTFLHNFRGEVDRAQTWGSLPPPTDPRQQLPERRPQMR